MGLSIQLIGGKSVVSFPKRADLVGDDAASAKAAMKRLISEGHVQLVFDMRNVALLDSAGLGALISALKKLRDVGGTFALANVGENATAVLRTTGLIRVFEVHPSLEAALASRPAVRR